MSWRYQVVWRDHLGLRVYSVCELYFGEDDKLEGWTDTAEIWPSGESGDELRRDLIAMLVDGARWAPVAFDALRVGMTFEALLSLRECEEIAETFDETASEMKL